MGDRPIESFEGGNIVYRAERIGDVRNLEHNLPPRLQQRQLRLEKPPRLSYVLEHKEMHYEVKSPFLIRNCEFLKGLKRADASASQLIGE